MPTVATATSSWRSAGDSIPTRVLVYGMVRRDGRLLTDDLYPVAEACGLTKEQVRSCLRRLVDDDRFCRSGSGKSAEYHLTDYGRATLAGALARRELAYRQDAAGQGWDRTWHLIGFAIPEERRSDRAAFRDYLLSLGAAPLQGGLYASPHAWEDEVAREAEARGVAAHVLYATTDDLRLGDITDPCKIAADLWPLEDLAVRYQRFVDEFSSVPDALVDMAATGVLLSDTEFLAGALAMLVRVYECQASDPLLPPELLPKDWPGRRARQVAADCRRSGLVHRENPESEVPFHAVDQLELGLL